MIAFNVTSTAQWAVPAGSCDFLHIYNNSGATVYVSYDGDVATVAAGIPIADGEYLHLNNDGRKQIFIRGLSVIHAESGNREIRIQKG